MLFKSLLFLCPSIIIHLMGGCKDIWFTGSICYSMPLTSLNCLNVSNMSLCGFPFYLGFILKISLLMVSFVDSNLFIMVLFYLSLGLTSIYSVSLFYYKLLSNFKFSCYYNMMEEFDSVKYSVVILSLFSKIWLWSYITTVFNLDVTFLLLPLYLKVTTLLMMILEGFLDNFSSKWIFLFF